MTDFKKTVDRKNRFGNPPEKTKTGGNLDAPETAPGGRRGKSTRVIPFSAKVTPEFNETFRELAFKGKMKHVELLEKCLETYIESLEK